MDLIIQSIIFGLAVVFMLAGLVGVVIPLLPGTLLLWLTVAVYAIVERLNGFGAIDLVTFFILTLIALVTGLADIWLPLLGAKVSGSTPRSMLYGAAGAILGTFVLPLLGSIIGYVVGILIGEYRRLGDWEKARRAALGGAVGWGIATVIQLGGGLMILIIFVWQVLAYQGLPAS